MQPDTVSVNTALSALSRGGVTFAQKDHQFGTHRFFDTALLVTFQHVGRWLVAHHLISELPTSQVQLGIVGRDLSFR